MNEEHIKEPSDGLIRHGPEIIANIRKEFNIDNKENRVQAVNIIEEWIKKQDHFVKKDFSTAYIERCIMLCKGSVERAKAQIDRICTMRTLMPKYFPTSDSIKSNLNEVFDLVYFAIMPRLTKEYYRTLIVKAKPNVVITSADQYILFYKCLILMAEYLSANEYCKGFLFIGDYSDVNILHFLYKINLLEFQQFLPILTDGYGCKIKGIYLVTSSKLLEGFVTMMKSVLSPKIGSRIHTVNNRSEIHKFIDSNCIPAEYGGIEKPIEVLNDHLLENLSSEPVRNIIEEMSKAVTDETKRQIDTFNGKYMGMPGTFRTLSLD